MIKLIREKINIVFNTRVYLSWTIIFCVVFFVATFSFWTTGTSLIWKVDSGLDFKTVLWYSKYLKECVYKVFVEHSFDFRLWDYYMGEGTDIILFTNQYCLGDPFMFFSVLVPDKYIYIFFQAVSILRLYLSGIAFIILCKEFKINNSYAIISGALVYCFSYYQLLHLAYHQFFLIPLPLMPLIIVGIEKIINENKPYFYIIIIFISCISNVYFFYQMALLTLMYVILRLVSVYKKNFKIIIKYIFKIGIYTLLALLMSAIVLIPVLDVMLNNGRIGLDYYNLILYPFNYYIDFINNFISIDKNYWTCLGFASVSIISIYILYRNKTSKLLMTIFTIVVIMLLLPIFGKIFNGMGYVINRWSWCLSLIVAFIVSFNFDSVTTIEKNKGLELTIFLAIIVVFYCMTGFKLLSSIQLVVVCLYLALVLTIYNYKTRCSLFVLFVCISIIVNATFLYSQQHNNHINECYKQDEINKVMLYTDADIIKEEDNNNNKREEYFRYSKLFFNHPNEGMISKVSSTNYYNSYTPRYLRRFKNVYGLLSSRNAAYFKGYDFSTILLELASVKYIIPTKNYPIPYGYELVEKSKNIYKNKYFLPIICTYDNVINYNDVDINNPINVQDLSMQIAIVDDYKGKINSISSNNDLIDNNIENIDYKLSKITNNVDIRDNMIITYENNQQIKIDFDGIMNKETHIIWSNLNYKPFCEYDLYYKKNIVTNGKKVNIDKSNKYVSDSLSFNKNISLVKEKVMFGLGPTTTIIRYKTNNNINNYKYFLTNKFEYYGGDHNFDVNLGYNEKSMNSVTLTLEQAGIYTFDKILLYTFAMNNYSNYVNKLKSGKTRDVLLSDNKISFNSNYDKDKFVCVSMPYYNGWEAYIDGHKTNLYVTNIYHMGLDVPKGNHSIELKYENKSVILGGFVSSFGSILFAVYSFMEKKMRNKNI